MRVCRSRGCSFGSLRGSRAGEGWWDLGFNLMLGQRVGGRWGARGLGASEAGFRGVENCVQVFGGSRGTDLGPWGDSSVLPVDLMRRFGGSAGWARAEQGGQVGMTREGCRGCWLQLEGRAAGTQ